jgi:anti-anti-sigma factor
MGDDAPRTVQIQLAGEYDMSRAEELDQAFSAARDADIVVIDFRAVTYIDSSVLTQLAHLQKTLRKRGPGIVVLQDVDPAVMRIFTLTGLDRVFEFRSSVN